MAEIRLGNRGMVALVDDVDLPYLNQYRWRAVRKRSNLHEFYAARTFQVNGKTHQVFMHRDILSAPAGLEVDHRNHDGLDNRRRNLRLATHSQNICNSRVKRNGTGFLGVYPSRTSQTEGGLPFIARASIAKRRYNLGVYPDAISAACAYDDAAHRIHGEFAKLNFPHRYALQLPPLQNNPQTHLIALLLALLKIC